MSNPAILRQLEAAMTRAKGNKSLAKRYLLEAAAADHALLLALAEPFMDSIAGYALDLYARKHPDGAKLAAMPPEPEQKKPVVTSAKQKAAMELLAASYKNKK